MQKPRLFSLNNLLLILVICIVAGCAQKPVTDYNPQRNFMALHNYAWSDKSLNSAKDGIVDNALVDKRVRMAVDEQLFARNFQKTKLGKPDFLVTYHITIKETLAPRSSLGLGLGGFNAGYMLGGGVAVHEYEETQLFVDMLDPHTLELIWRGSVKYPTVNSLTPDERAEEMREKVAIILSAFPPY